MTNTPLRPPSLSESKSTIPGTSEGTTIFRENKEERMFLESPDSALERGTISTEAIEIVRYDVGACRST